MVSRLVLSLAAALTLAVGHSAARIPPGIREIDVRSPSGLVRVTDPAKVDRIVRWFDRLPTVRPGVFYCPMLVNGPQITLTFRNADGVLARARYAADSSNHSLVSRQCDPISYRVLSRSRRALIGGHFLQRVQRLIGEQLLG
jgi:hypothetical protein